MLTEIDSALFTLKWAKRQKRYQTGILSTLEAVAPYKRVHDLWTVSRTGGQRLQTSLSLAQLRRVHLVERGQLFKPLALVQQQPSDFLHTARERERDRQTKGDRQREDRQRGDRQEEDRQRDREREKECKWNQT